MSVQNGFVGKANTGNSIVEVLLSMLMLGLGVAALTISINVMQTNMLKALHREIEGAYASARLAEYFPSYTSEETNNPNSTTTSYIDGAVVQTTEPDGSTFSTRRYITSDPTHPEVRIATVQLFNTPTSSAFLTLTREYPPNFIGYSAGVTCSGAFLQCHFKVDSQNRVWRELNTDLHGITTVTGPAGSTILANNGMESTFKGSLSYASSFVSGYTPLFNGLAGLPPTLHNDAFLFNQGLKGVTSAACTAAPYSASACIGYSFVGTIGRSYTVIIHFIEPNATEATNKRKTNVFINGTQVDTVDPVAAAGSTRSVLVKQYTGQAAVDDGTGNSTGVIKVILAQASGATDPPFLTSIGLIRDGF